MWYPEEEDLKKANKKAIDLLRITKAEKHEVLSNIKLNQIVNNVKESRGSPHYKAALLLHDINRQHPFGSANKRTSYMVAQKFLFKNTGHVKLKRKQQASYLLDVRHGKKKPKQIARWLHG